MQRLSLTPAPSTTSTVTLPPLWKSTRVQPSSPFSKPLLTTSTALGSTTGGTGGSGPGSPSPSPPHDQSAAADRTTHKKNRIFFIIGIFKIQSFQGFQRGDLCRKGYRPEQPPASRAAIANGRGIPCVPPAIGPARPSKVCTVGQQHFDTESARRTVRTVHNPEVEINIPRVSVQITAGIDNLVITVSSFVGTIREIDEYPPVGMSCDRPKY